MSTVSWANDCGKNLDVSPCCCVACCPTSCAMRACLRACGVIYSLKSVRMSVISSCSKSTGLGKTLSMLGNPPPAISRTSSVISWESAVGSITVSAVWVVLVLVCSPLRFVLPSLASSLAGSRYVEPWINSCCGVRCVIPSLTPTVLKTGRFVIPWSSLTPTGLRFVKPSTPWLGCVYPVVRPSLKVLTKPSVIATLSHASALSKQRWGESRSYERPVRVVIPVYKSQKKKLR